MPNSIQYFLELDRSLTPEELNELENLLGDANHKYRYFDIKVMSDQDYDDGVALLERHDRQVPMWSFIPPGVKTTDIPHSYDNMMCTLSKQNNMDDLREWFLKVLADHQNVSVIASLKYDGNSGLVDYDIGTGKAESAMSRGEDGKGVDLLPVLGQHRINADPIAAGNVGMKYEIILTYEDMEGVSDKRGKALVNPRSAISGIMGRDNGREYFPFIKLVPLGVAFKDGTSMTRAEEFDLMNELLEGASNILEPRFEWIEGTLDEVLAGIKSMYDELSVTRRDLPYMIDGLVIELFNEDDRERLGWHKGSTKVLPNYATALKFPYLEAPSEVVRMEFDYGRSTGRYTPCVIFKAVNFFGTTHTRQSIANYARFKELALGVGTKVLIQYRNDTLSYVQKLDVAENEGIVPIPFLTHCTICGAEVVVNENETFAYCSNLGCSGRVIGGALTWLIKLGVKGVGESTLERCHAAGLLTSIRSLYDMDYDAVAQLDGLGTSSAQKMKDAVLAKTTITDAELIGSVSIEGIGRSTCREMFKVISLNELLEACYAGTGVELLMSKEVPGIGDINAEKIQAGVAARREFFEWAVGYFTIEETPKGGSDGMTIVVTGDVTKWATRGALKRVLEGLGHKVTGSVSKKTDILLTNDQTTGTTKLKKARTLQKEGHHIRIVDENELVTIIPELEA